MVTPSTNTNPAMESGVPPKPPEWEKSPISGWTCQGFDVSQNVLIPGGSSASAVQASCPVASFALAKPRLGAFGSESKIGTKSSSKEDTVSEKILRIGVEEPFLERLRNLDGMVRVAMSVCDVYYRRSKVTSLTEF